MLAFLSFIGFTLLVAGFAYYKTHNARLTESTEGYFLGGRSLTGVYIGSSMLLMNLSTEHLIGLNGLAFRTGFIVMAWEVIAAVTIVLFAIYFLPKYLKLGISTIPEYLERRFDKNTLLITSILFLAMYIISLLPIVLYTGAIALESLFQVSNVFRIDKTTALWIMVWGVGGLGAVYAIFGGIKAIAAADTINGIGLIVGGLMVTIFALLYVGNGNAWQGLVEVYQSNPDKFNSIGSEDSLVPFSTLFTGLIVSNMFFWCTNQSIVQKALGAKNLAEGQKGVMLCALLKLIMPSIIILPGIIAFHIFKGQIDNPDNAYPELVHLILPEVLVGFFAAVVVGAVFSTFSGGLNSSVTLFIVNIYKPRINQNATETQTVAMSKYLGIGLALITMIVAPLVANAPDGLFYLIQQLQGIFNAPILSVVLVGLMTKRVPPIAAKLGLLFGMSAYIICNFILKIDLHFFHLVGILFVLNVIFMLAIGYFFPAKPFADVYTEQVNITPWSMVKPVAWLITLCSISIYIFLAHNVPKVIMIIYYLFAVLILSYALYQIGKTLFSKLAINSTPKRTGK
ncbi:solute:sodium symporter family transporter [Photorhabdus laumondii subsp. laumondii]|uniref:Solute:sodium symporter family transporter n=1 Tax=Photorhabdus laumondii subsp. laumondii TaxID=141679 RepID=A0A6L9JHS8_PHOLM|nr:MULTISPECIES: solute:sodium symporter family transporter [Photorhabdus]AWK41627.1 solute:sodium symporter family transporter [Photorhabdus laumondii subsp. laumondii]AXG42465.1 solute:sodium symporter family transporter [Photorhabdus laumondii subsp. laumondii]KTL60432.1 transporter [Photorhabdus laumondii subsp. laumondii]MCC8384408.1 solute:sodium symporter family transporter [Photorhabdus laumondii]MCC8388649.1 solute:sodium symporter family transporter [Photorhabdus laumondii]